MGCNPPADTITAAGGSLPSRHNKRRTHDESRERAVYNRWIRIFTPL